MSCACSCGYTCGRQCGLPLFSENGCIANHYKVDCEHKWDGDTASGETWESGTCSKCGMVQMHHDISVGP